MPKNPKDVCNAHPHLCDDIDEMKEDIKQIGNDVKEIRDWAIKKQAINGYVENKSILDSKYRLAGFVGGLSLLVTIITEILRYIIPFHR